VFMVCRALFDIGMGGEWGAALSVIDFSRLEPFLAFQLAYLK